ncbi:hypothetical protein BX070DRAFT_238035 [Coemansia spiralis]|nr:hypothetical protein BX070DRAFT_238035 [Coemansia spiralis]
MVVYSRSQTLPLHTAEQIACYMLGYTIPHFPRYHHGVGNMQTLSALYNISQPWRNIALGYYYRLIKLTLAKRISAENCKFLGVYEFIEDKGINNLLYVKNVWVKIDRTCLCSTSVGLQILNSAWPSNYIFSLARRVKVAYYDSTSKYNTNSVQVESEIISAVINQIFCQIPKLQKIHIACTIDYKHNHDDQYQSTIAYSMDSILTTSLSQVKNLINISTIGPCRAKKLPHMYEGAVLTHLDLQDGFNADICKYTIKRNASTLNILKIFCLSPHNAAQDLIFDNESLAKTYPRLEEIELGYYLNDKDIVKQEIDKAIIPFSVLNRIVWRGSYPFSDDALFRENSNNLTYLLMEASEIFVLIARKRKYFIKIVIQNSGI